MTAPLPTTTPRQEELLEQTLQLVREVGLAGLTVRKLAERKVSVPFAKAAVATEGPLLGKSLCVTGVLTRKREDVHTAIRAAGGEVHDSVKAGTTFLVAGEKVGQTKLDAAKKRGTKVITEAELYEMLGA